MSNQGNGAGRVEWTWGRGPLLNRQFPWHYPQPHTTVPISAAEIWGERRRIALYLHTPFCREKCDYCNYAVTAHPRREAIRRYVDALLREIEICSAIPWFRTATATSVYFGGGSPSILDDEWLAEIVGALRGRFAIAPDAEISIECNPIEVDDAKLDTFRRLGVNRVSVGVQSFDAETLQSMRRAHSAALAAEAFARVKAAGFGNVNLDLIYAYPTQDLARLARTVDETLALSPDRISCASLSIFPKTELFYKIQTGKVAPLSEEAEIEMFNLLLDRIPPAGYEIESLLCFARPGIRFRQEEEVLLDGVEMIGLGVSAFSVANGHVWANTSSLADYYHALEEEGRLPIHRGRRLDMPTQIAMALIHGLRFLGIDAVRFKRRFGVDVEQVYPEKLSKLMAGGLLEPRAGGYRLTREGMIHVGPIMRELYREPPVLYQTYQGDVIPAAAATLAAIGQ